jgi:predicted nuclease with TOPRIM domain
MGLLTDILKEVPLSPEIRQEIAKIEAHYESLKMEQDGLKTENVILKDNLRDAKAQIMKLERQVDHFTHNPELDDTDILILKEIALTSDPAAPYLAEKLNLSLAMVEFRLERLMDIDYLSAWSIGGAERYSLQPKSREYLIKNNLIS